MCHTHPTPGVKEGAEADPRELFRTWSDRPLALQHMDRQTVTA